jgi:hypothetical protein
LTNLDLEKKISTAFDDIAPNDFEKIFASFQQTSKFKNKKILYRSIISLAAVFVLVFGAAFGFNILKQNNTVDSRICIDINPSIVLEVNKKEKVLSTEAKNEDAEKVLEGLNLKGKDLSDAVDLVIDSVVKHGYIDGKSNSVLVSVDNGDQNKGAELQKRLSESVSKALQKDGVEGAVLSQTLEKNAESQKLANEYGISEGKVQLINEILKIKEDYTFADLANLSINELNLLCDSGEAIKGHIDANGIASDERYIGKDKAKEIAFNAINMTEDDVTNYECNLILEKGRMLYAVTFVVRISGEQVDIDALNGEIVRNSLADEQEKEPEKAENTTDKEENKNDKTENKPAKEETPKYITEKQAQKIAYEHARVVDKKKKYVNVNSDPSGKAYNVHFTCEGYEYYYRISATGKIVRNSKWIVDIKLLENISEKKAKNVVFTHLNIEETLAINPKITLNDDEMKYYFSFEYDKYKYVYTINSKTGEILDITKELTDAAIAEGFTEVELIDEAFAKRVVFSRLTSAEKKEVTNYTFEVDEAMSHNGQEVYYITFNTKEDFWQCDIDMKTGLLIYIECCAE